MSRKKGDKEYHPNESWLLPYADLLTLLLALFIVLFAMSEVDVKKYKELSEVFKNEFSGGQTILEHSDMPVEISKKDLVREKDDKEKENDNHAKELEELQTVQAKVDQYIVDNKLTKVLETHLADEGLLITILNDISFDSGSAKVKKKGEKIAKDVSALLYTDPPHQIVISGHADDRPIHTQEFASNWELSVMRAVNFMTLLLKDEDHDPTRFSAKGFGEHKPIVPNTSEKNRAKNRRVEVLILPNYEIRVDGEAKK